MACTRITINRKLRMFPKMAVVISDVQSMVTFGSHIDVPVPQPIVEVNLRSITLVTNGQVQIRDYMSFVNEFAGATVTPSALMKNYATMARETTREVNEPTLEPCQKVLETFSCQRGRALSQIV